MKVYDIHHEKKPISQIKTSPSVLALGFFDGLHLGHQKLLQEAKQIAKKKRLEFAVMTFYPHPSQMIPAKNKITKYLSPLYIKEKMMSSLGVETMYVVDFNSSFSRLSPQDFVDQYIVGANAKHVVAGFDFRYGFKGQGTMEQLKIDSANRFEVTTISKIEKNAQKISSTLIRQLLRAGRVAEIPNYLGDYYAISGKVKTISPSSHDGYTDRINMQAEKDYVIPIHGTYHVEVNIGQETYHGMCEVTTESLDGNLQIFLETPLAREILFGEVIHVSWIDRVEAVSHLI